jgi:hypothetical protein
MRVVIAAALMSFAFGLGTAAAQNPPPAPTPAPAAQTAAPGKMSAADRKAISKSCTDQANAKGLHGKARKKFRSECKHNGGKPQ